MKGMIWGLAAALAFTAPAFAQFAAPYGGGYGAPGLYSAPEAASGAIGAGAANSAATQAQCAQAAGAGRDRGHTSCAAGSGYDSQRR